MRVGEAEVLELLARPVVGVLGVRRAGQAFANAIHQPAGNLHDFGVMEAFVADPVDHVQVNLFFFLGQDGRKRKDKKYGDKNGSQTPRGLHGFSFVRRRRNEVYMPLGQGSTGREVKNCGAEKTHHGGTETRRKDRVIGSSGHRIIGTSDNRDNRKRTAERPAISLAADDPMNRSPDDPIFCASPWWVFCVLLTSAPRKVAPSV